MQRTKAEWVRHVETDLPPEEQFSRRNRAITARYAGWYLACPEMFKWAGMASFASRQVGMAIVMAEMLAAPERMGQDNLFASLHRFAAQQFMMQDFDAMRKGNNNIFRDIAWAHAAYLDGGLAAVDSCCTGPDRGLLLEGFGMIDRGMDLQRRHVDVGEGEDLIWKGNLALLRHEQTTVLQPVFDSLTPGGRLLASLGSELDFTCDMPADPKYRASFTSHCGYLETLAGMKSIADPVHRWEWVETCVVSAWMAADRALREGTAGKGQLLAMAAGEPGLLQQISSFTGGLLPVN